MEPRHQAPARGLPDPEAWLENVAFPEPADDPALAELEDEDLVLGADELVFDVEQWREASERYAASERGATRRAGAETTRVQSRRTRALPRQESSRRNRRGSGTNTGPTRRIPRAAAPITPSVRSRAARSVTTRLRALPPRPAAQPPQGRPSQPCWGATVRRPSFRVSRGGLSRAQALAVTWPELTPADPTPRKTRPPLEILALAALSLGLLLALGGPFLLRDRSAPPSRETTSAALTTAPAAEPQGPTKTAPNSQRSAGLALGTQGATASQKMDTGPREASATRANTSSRDAGPIARSKVGDPRLRRRGSRARSRRLASEEILGTVGGTRLRFGLACGTYGANAFVPLRLERLPDLPPTRTLTWELRHDARLSVDELSAGPAAHEAGATVDFEALGPGRLRIRVTGERPVGTGELCVLRLRVPSLDVESPLPAYLPLEAIALRLDDRAPRLGAGARGALRLEP